MSTARDIERVMLERCLQIAITPGGWRGLLVFHRKLDDELALHAPTRHHVAFHHAKHPALPGSTSHHPMHILDSFATRTAIRPLLDSRK